MMLDYAFMDVRRHTLQLVGALLLGGLCLTSSHAQEGLRHETSIIISQLADCTGDLDYEIRIGGPSRYAVPVDSITLTAPDGTRMGWQVEGGRSYAIETAASFEELGTRFFGQWSATETLVSGENVDYEFELVHFELTDVFSEIPTVLSPVSGSTLPLDFTVNWSYESGTIPMLQAVARSEISAGVRVFNTVSYLPTSMDVEVELTGQHDAIDVAFRAGNLMRLENGIDFVPPFDRMNDSFSFRTYFQTLSPPVEFVVAVPEPPTALLMFSAAALVARCRLKTEPGYDAQA